MKSLSISATILTSSTRSHRILNPEQEKNARFESFPDNGCNVHPSCLECPLPQCKHDDPEAYLIWKHDKETLPRDIHILQLWESGMNTREIADIVHLNPKTVAQKRDKMIDLRDSS